MANIMGNHRRTFRRVKDGLIKKRTRLARRTFRTPAEPKTAPFTGAITLNIFIDKPVPKILVNLSLAVRAVIPDKMPFFLICLTMVEVKCGTY